MMITNRTRPSCLALALAAGCLVVAGAPGAYAAGATSTTQHVHGVDVLDPNVTTNPCTGDPVSGTQDGNLVGHETVHGDEIWATFTEEESVQITDYRSDGSTISYSGRFTAWGNYNLNQQNSTSTFTSSVRLTGSDGSIITSHEVTQFVLLPDGTVGVAFDKPSLTCGGV